MELLGIIYHFLELNYALVHLNVINMLMNLKGRFYLYSILCQNVYDCMTGWEYA